MSKKEEKPFTKIDLTVADLEKMHFQALETEYKQITLFFTLHQTSPLIHSAFDAAFKPEERKAFFDAVNARYAEVQNELFAFKYKEELE